jgi:sugar phosphate isomerase/epimerase
MSDIPRRTFLKTAAGATAVALGLPATMHASPAPSGVAAADALKLGVASYSFRNFPREKAIQMMKPLDTPYINLKSMHLPFDLSPAETRAAAGQFGAAGLKLVGAGLIIFEKNTDEAVRKYFEYAKNAGIPLLTVTGPHDIWPRVERFVKMYDIKVAIHNHGPEDEDRYPTPRSALEYIDGMDPRVGLCIDIGHTARTGTDVVKAIAEAGPRLLDMHVKDLLSFDPHARGAAVGKGIMPIPAIFEQLLAMNYQGQANLEYEVEGEADDPLPGMTQSFAYMRGVLAGLTRGRAGARRG